MITYSDVRASEAIRVYIKKADEALAAMGYTEHSLAHVGRVAQKAAYILETLGYPGRDAELARIAGHLHDMGNLVNRTDHAQSGAVMAFRILDNMGASPEDIAIIVSAIGNHDESTAVPVNAIAAALILADKSDVRRSRVRNRDISSFDIHDRVNYSVTSSDLIISDDKKTITLTLELDTSLCPVMDYFEIFMGRMILCRKAAAKLGLTFALVANGQKLL